MHPCRLQLIENTDHSGQPPVSEEKKRKDVEDHTQAKVAEDTDVTSEDKQPGPDENIDAGSRRMAIPGSIKKTFIRQRVEMKRIQQNLMKALKQYPHP